MTPTRCPCLSGETYDHCCGPFHAGRAQAPTAEQLMRSRYSAFAVGDVEYLRATWHPRTRPADLELDPAVRWTRLEVLDVRGGGPLPTVGTGGVRTHHRLDRVRGFQHEVRHLVRAGGRRVSVRPVAPPR